MLPVVRFVSMGGVFLSQLRVEAVYTDAGGRQRSVDLLPGALPSRNWQPTLPMLQLAGLINTATLNGLTTEMSFRFTPRGVFGAGNWQIDGVYVDPWKRI